MGSFIDISIVHEKFTNMVYFMCTKKVQPHRKTDQILNNE